MNNWSRRRGNGRAATRLKSNLSNALLSLRIACFAASVPFLLRLPLPTVDRLLKRRRHRARVDPDRLAKIVAYSDAAAGRRFVRRSCLVRGTTLYYFLTRSGVDLSLSFGIGQVDGRFAGHCWLVKDGQPYLEKQDPRPTFTVIYSMPRDESFAAPVATSSRIAP